MNSTSKDDLFKAILGLDSLKPKVKESEQSEESERNHPTYYDYNSLSPSELKQKLFELRNAFKVMSFKLVEVDINDFHAYIMMKLDDFDVRITALENKEEKCVTNCHE